MVKWNYDTNYPSAEDLRSRAIKKIPRFAFEYLDGGCNEEVNLKKNIADLKAVELMPHYLEDFAGASMQTELFGHVYDAPFGIAPIGLQGLMWPGSPEILAKAAFEHNIPFILSTVTTSSIETISEITEGKAWFQLYHPAEDRLRDDILERCNACRVPVLVLLCDTPSFGFRHKDIRNGLAMPPRMSIRNIFQIMQRPHWALETLLKGTPEFKTLKPYMPSSLNMQQLGLFMNQTFNGRLNRDKIAAIRDKWKGRLVLKGVAGLQDAATATELGIDGIIVSNHGGRQIDAGQSAIQSLIPIAENYGHKIKVMMDSGIRSGPDIARAMACGAAFTFSGRIFMYSVAALGKKGGHHAIAILKSQLQQVMEQLCCATTGEFKEHRIKGGY